MKAVFCYDGPLYKDKNGNYYDSILNDQMFERYFKVADQLELVIRTRDVNEKTGLKKMGKISNPNIHVTECPNLSSVNGLLGNQKKAKIIIENSIRQADLVFIRVPSVIGNLSIDIARKLKKKYLVEVVGCPWDAYWNYSLKGKIVAPFATYIMKKRVKNAPFVLYVTNKFLQGRYPTKGRQINCSNVELAEADNEILAARIEKINNYSSTSVYKIGTAAGLDVLYKGQQYIIQAIAELKKKGITNIEYELIGGGTGSYLKKLARELDVEDQVKILGQMPHDEVFSWLDGLDIYAQPSRQEGLPRSVIEAMSRALPCIGARTAGIPELLNGECIFSNSSREISEICLILSNMVHSSNKMKKYAEENFVESKKYARKTLVNRRTHFFVAYKNAVEEK